MNIPDQKPKATVPVAPKLPPNVSEEEGRKGHSTLRIQSLNWLGVPEARSGEEGRHLCEESAVGSDLAAVRWSWKGISLGAGPLREKGTNAVLEDQEEEKQVSSTAPRENGF